LGPQFFREKVPQGPPPPPSSQKKFKGNWRPPPTFGFARPRGEFPQNQRLESPRAFSSFWVAFPPREGKLLLRPFHPGDLGVCPPPGPVPQGFPVGPQGRNSFVPGIPFPVPATGGPRLFRLPSLGTVKNSSVHRSVPVVPWNRSGPFPSVQFPSPRSGTFREPGFGPEHQGRNSPETFSRPGSFPPPVPLTAHRDPFGKPWLRNSGLPLVRLEGFPPQWTGPEVLDRPIPGRFGPGRSTPGFPKL